MTDYLMADDLWLKKTVMRHENNASALLLKKIMLYISMFGNERNDSFGHNR